MISARRTRRIALAALVVVLLLGLVLGGLVIGQGRRTLPQTTGKVAIPGLDSSVEVLRDRRGVPHIYADTMDDLMRAQGYVQAQDRFFEMDTRRHITSGRLAELVGEPGVETDKVIRTMGWRRTAEAELSMLAPETRQSLSAFTDGVNAWLDEHGSAPSMAVEYTILSLSLPEYRVEDWTPVDSLTWLKAMAWDLRGNFDDELTRAMLEGQVNEAMIDDYFPKYPSSTHDPILSRSQWRPEPRTPRRTEEEAKGERAAKAGTGRGASTPRDASTALASTAAAVDEIPALLGQGEGIGSNSWVVSGDRSTTGKPLLANDPHLGVSMPGIWYQMGLHCREVTASCPVDVSGYTFAGIPGIVIGHNADIAWGFTNLAPDVTDFYLEKVNDGKYLRDGKQAPLKVRTETIKVAGGKDEKLTIRSTPNGPILSDVMPTVADAGRDVEMEGQVTSDYAVSMAWTGLKPSRTADAILSLNTASNFTEFRAAAKEFAVPSQNLTYADVKGNIGYQAPGNIPIRKGVRDKPPGWMPAPGWDSDYAWRGYVPFAELPYALNPESGYLVTANQQVTSRSTPFLTTDWDYGYRSQRITDLIESEDKVSPEKMARMQLDTHNGLAAELLPHLVRVDVDDFTADGQDLLRHWDQTQPAGRDDNTAAAAYFNATWRHIVQMTFNDELPAQQQADGGSQEWAAIEGLLDEPRNPWWDDRSTPGAVESRDEVLRQALVDARLDLTRSLGKEPSSWDWGRMHQVSFQHTVLGGEDVPGPVRGLVNFGPHPVSGGSSTVNATAWDASVGFDVAAAPSMRMVVDLSNLDASRWVNQTGNSGHPFSPHYQDQIDAWLAGRTYAWPSSRAAVTRASEDRLTLTPGKSAR